MDTPIDTPISLELKHEISRNLEQYHKVFDIFWNLCDIGFSTSVPTACVGFPRGGRSYMKINPIFWKALGPDGQLFIILHECLHVMLDHGIRNGREIEGATPELVNIAQDITINEIIIAMFEFERGLLPQWNKYCWIDTCFKDPSQIERHQVFDYYMRKLIEQGPFDAMPVLMDDHNSMKSGGFTDDDGPDELAGKLAEELTPDLLEALLKTMANEMGRGVSSSPFKTLLERQEAARLDFKTIVKKLKRSAKSKELKDLSSFSNTSRRFQSMGGKLILPGAVEGKPNFSKLITLVFFDVSGSCMQYIKHLQSVNEAFAEETNLFDVRSYAFDTAVQPVTIGQPLNLGGGTAFNIIEAECQKVEKEEGKYPDCVVVITDGYGNGVHPKFPQRWIWLLTPGASRSFIHRDSQAWPIKNVTY